MTVNDDKYVPDYLRLRTAYLTVEGCSNMPMSLPRAINILQEYAENMGKAYSPHGWKYERRALTVTEMREKLEVLEAKGYGRLDFSIQCRDRDCVTISTKATEMVGTWYVGTNTRIVGALLEEEAPEAVVFSND
jgi:hypothetical protein